MPQGGFNERGPMFEGIGGFFGSSVKNVAITALIERVIGTINGCKVTACVITPEGSVWIPELGVEIPAACQDHAVNCSIQDVLRKKSATHGQAI